mmetsp:Transcript_88169/g.222537  ORF Transcript_88169/g.222537 Transcript_88169/m.222537 type:complete len:120 (-) Transcript_88169:956-1315(-)
MPSIANTIHTSPVETKQLTKHDLERTQLNSKKQKRSKPCNAKIKSKGTIHLHAPTNLYIKCKCKHLNRTAMWQETPMQVSSSPTWNSSYCHKSMSPHCRAMRTSRNCNLPVGDDLIIKY